MKLFEMKSLSTWWLVPGSVRTRVKFSTPLFACNSFRPSKIRCPNPSKGCRVLVGSALTEVRVSCIGIPTSPSGAATLRGMGRAYSRSAVHNAQFLHDGSNGCAGLESRRLSVAPMMDWTDVYYRQLARLLTKHTWLYTEMVVDKTIIHNADRLDRWLEHPSPHSPTVLQLGGSNPRDLEQAARLARRFAFEEINLNCGCPR
eukprot:CAMPEP_0114318876 /NCGR_PEP_ID=MMETSP0059-20121206/24920_1 /TAXON_ID=36894 /ORGANISM="Pyramimonas parkeae, Strain CCMP726" /LENGTH=201 /DNA_ID=CAMNT_0001445803 /DNA_START=94 /DNA_END=696 /DNA_ORIENTATION=+